MQNRKEIRKKTSKREKQLPEKREEEGEEEKGIFTIFTKSGVKKV